MYEMNVYEQRIKWKTMADIWWTNNVLNMYMKKRWSKYNNELWMCIWYMMKQMWIWYDIIYEWICWYIKWINYDEKKWICTTIMYYDEYVNKRKLPWLYDGMCILNMATSSSGKCICTNIYE